MKIIFKRIIAYLLDVFIITLISTLLVSNKYININYEKYQTVFETYNKEYNEYDYIIGALNDSFDDEKITKKEYSKITKRSNKYKIIMDNYFDDSKITKNEYNKIIKEIEEVYSNTQTTNNYKLIKYSTIPTIISVLTILLYFVVIQYNFNGQTLGKKIMKLRVVSNSDKKLTIYNFFIRSLIVNEIFINILNIVFVNILSKNNYIFYNQIIYIITYILETCIIFSILIDKNNRGIHDYVSNSKVIEEKEREYEV